MRKLLRKVLLIIVLFTPLFINTDCKKQKRCGCRGDDLGELWRDPVYVWFDDESSIIQLRTIYDSYAYYTVCNSDEIKPKLADFKTGVELVVSGKFFWDCNYVMEASNYSYSSYIRRYNIYVEDIYINLYGSDETDETLKGAK